MDKSLNASHTEILTGPEDVADPDGPSPCLERYADQANAFFSLLDKDDNHQEFYRSIDRPYLYERKLGNLWGSLGRPPNGYPITVNTSFDDATLIQEFRAWLATIRNADEAHGWKSRKTPFDRKDFDSWERFKVREVFDLLVWAQHSGAKIKHSVMAKAVWPDDDDTISPIDILRKTTFDKVNDVFSGDTVVRLYEQLRRQYGGNFWAD